jgi:hypothetical protein
MATSCYVYFNYKILVSMYGAKRSCDIAVAHIGRVFDHMESLSIKPIESYLLEHDGIKEAISSSYGAIAAFRYPSIDLSQTAAMMLMSWIAEQNNALATKLPILGVIHSQNNENAVSSLCAANLFNISLSYSTTLFCTCSDQTFKPRPYIPRTICDNNITITGKLICTKVPKYYVSYTSSKGVVMLNKDNALSLLMGVIENQDAHKGTVVYSYDGGNLLNDCDLVLYIRTLHAIALNSKKNAIISSDMLNLSAEIREKFTSTITVLNIVSYTLSNHVSFKEPSAEAQ